MNTLNIVTVGYNEEINLPKFFKSLEYIKGQIDIRHIYVDQSSTDNSVELAKNNGCEIYVHENKGYADPDKKWIVETLINNEEWCLILDCDEELTKELSDEIVKNIYEQKSDVFKIKLKTYFLGSSYVIFNQLRLFKKLAINLTDEIHNYIISIKRTNKSLKNFIINKDNKDLNKNIYNHIQKINIYSENELKKYNQISSINLVIGLFIKPFFTFSQWYFINRLFLDGLSGFIVSLNMSFYTFTIYTKLYENNINNNKKNFY